MQFAAVVFVDPQRRFGQILESSHHLEVSHSTAVPEGRGGEQLEKFPTNITMK